MKKNSKASSGQTPVKPSSTSRSILLLIPLRLGQDSFNMQYADGLKVQSVYNWNCDNWEIDMSKFNAF